MKRIIYKTDEGGVAVIVPSAEYLANHTIEELASKDVPSGAEHYIVDASIIPTDRKYRGAWELVNKKIEVNQVKASQMDAQAEAKAQLQASVINKIATNLTSEEKAWLEENL